MCCTRLPLRKYVIVKYIIFIEAIVTMTQNLILCKYSPESLPYYDIECNLMEKQHIQ